MSKFNFKNQTPPGTPETGQTFVYVDSVQKVLSSKDDTGAVVNYGGGGGGVTGANNGTWLSGANVQLGQPIGQAGDPGALLANTEIPMGAFEFSFIDRVTVGNYFHIKPGADGFLETNVGSIAGGPGDNFSTFVVDGSTNAYVEFYLKSNAGADLSTFFLNGGKNLSVRIISNVFLLDKQNSIYQIGDLDSVGNATFFTINDTRKGYNFNAVQTFADNAAALLGGLLAGDIYRITASDNLAIVH